MPEFDPGSEFADNESFRQASRDYDDSFSARLGTWIKAFKAERDAGGLIAKAQQVLSQYYAKLTAHFNADQLVKLAVDDPPFIAKLKTAIASGAGVQEQYILLPGMAVFAKGDNVVVEAIDLKGQTLENFLNSADPKSIRSVNNNPLSDELQSEEGFQAFKDSALKQYRMLQQGRQMATTTQNNFDAMNNIFGLGKDPQYAFDFKPPEPTDVINGDSVSGQEYYFGRTNNTTIKNNLIMRHLAGQTRDIVARHITSSEGDYGFFKTLKSIYKSIGIADNASADEVDAAVRQLSPGDRAAFEEQASAAVGEAIARAAPKWWEALANRLSSTGDFLSDFLKEAVAKQLAVWFNIFLVYMALHNWIPEFLDALNKLMESLSTCSMTTLDQKVYAFKCSWQSASTPTQFDLQAQGNWCQAPDCCGTQCDASRINHSPSGCWGLVEASDIPNVAGGTCDPSKNPAGGGASYVSCSNTVGASIAGCVDAKSQAVVLSYDWNRFGLYGALSGVFNFVKSAVSGGWNFLSGNALFIIGGVLLLIVVIMPLIQHFISGI